MLTEKLMKCPFCGEIADTYYNFFPRRPTDWVSVICFGCGARTDWHTTEQEAINAWNTRVKE